MIKEWCH